MFEKDGITYYEDKDLQTVSESSVAKIRVLGTNDVSYLTNKDIFALDDHPHYHLQGYLGANLRFWGTGDTTLESGRELWLQSVGAIKMSRGGVLRLMVSNFSPTVFIFGNLATMPAGGGYYVASDSFIEYSSLGWKEDIASIPDVERVFDAITPSEFTVSDRRRAGFVAQEQPREVRHTTQDENGKDIEGVDLGSILSILLQMVQDLKAEVRSLKAEI